MLKDLIKNKERGGYVIPVLNEAVILASKLDSMKRRRDCFHPSEVCGDFCPRAWIFGMHDKSLYLNGAPDVQTKWRFDVGSALHTLVQERLSETGRLMGMWKCKRWCMEGRCMFYGFKPNAEQICPMKTPHKAKFEYAEFAVTDDKLCLHGKTDGILWLDRGKTVFEFKTANSRTFDSLVEPLDVHKEQVLLYLDTLRRQDIVLEQELLAMQEEGSDVHGLLQFVRMPYEGATILYMNKDTQAMKEYWLDTSTPFKMPAGITVTHMDVADEDDMIADKRAMLQQTLDWYRQGVIPDRLEHCTTKGCSRAKKCFARDACFEEV